MTSPPPRNIGARRLVLFGIIGIMLTACGDDDVTNAINSIVDEFNTAPTIADQTFSVVENAAVNAEVGTVQASDADDDDLTFSITSGNTGDAFAINANSGLLTVAKALDFENTPTYTLKVSVSDGIDSNTADITVNVIGGNRRSTRDIDLAADNNSPVGLWSDGATLWVVDSDAKIYAYTLSDGSRDAAKDIDLDTDNNSPDGLWSDGTTLWVADGGFNNSRLYAYNLADGMRNAAKEFDLDPNNDRPDGLWSNGITIWVLEDDSFDDESKVYAYTLATGARDTAKEFDLTEDNSTPTVIWSDGTTLWVADFFDEKTYAYTLATGSRDASKEFDLGSGNNLPTGLWSDGTTLWVADPGDSDDFGDEKVYAYAIETTTPMPPPAPASVPALGTRLPVLDINLATDNESPEDFWSDGTTLWVSDKGDDKIYAYTLATGARDAAKDINLAMENDSPVGLWSNKTTLWIVQDESGWNALERNQIYAYVLATGARDATKDIDLAANNTNSQGIANISTPQGIWSDGTTLWVVDRGNNITNVEEKIYAYTLADGTRDANKDINLNTDNDRPYGLWSDGTTLWVSNDDFSNSDNDKVYAYRLTDGTRDADREFGLAAGSRFFRPRHIWSDGTTLWVLNGTDEKIYAYQLK